jgi:hypothetical protein
VPRKIRNLVADLTKAEFFLKPGQGKGSHMLWAHRTGVQILLSGNMGDDAHPRAEKKVREAIAEAQRRMRDQETGGPQ